MEQAVPPPQRHSAHSHLLLFDLFEKTRGPLCAWGSVVDDTLGTSRLGYPTRVRNGPRQRANDGVWRRGKRERELWSRRDETVWKERLPTAQTSTVHRKGGPSTPSPNPASSCNHSPISSADRGGAQVDRSRERRARMRTKV